MDMEQNLNLAQEKIDNSNFSQALEILQDIIEEDPRNPKAYYMAGHALNKQGKLGQSMKVFEKVLEIDPHNTEASIALSVLYNDIGEYDKGRKVYEKAMSRVTHTHEETDTQKNVNLKFSMKHCELAESYAAYKRFNEAIGEFERAIKLAPNSIELKIKLAKLYCKKGMLNKGIAELIQLRNQYPEDLSVISALGKCYFDRGNVLEAQIEWQKVLKKDPHNQEAKNYMNWSQSIKETIL